MPLLRVNLPERDWWIDLPELTSIQLGEGALRFFYADKSSELIMRSDDDEMNWWIDLPKLTSLTTDEGSRSFENPRFITLESTSFHSSSQTDIPSLTTITLDDDYVFAIKETVHTNSSSSSSPSFIDITPALQHYLQFIIYFTHNSSIILKRTHTPSNKSVFETRIGTSNTQLNNPREITINNKQTQQYTNYQHPSFPYFRGMNFDEWVAPIPGRLCFTGWYVRENSPR